MSDIDRTVVRLNEQLHAPAETATVLRDQILAAPRPDPEVVEDILHAEYRAYLCMMSDHGCDCVALSFDGWLLVWAGDR